MVHFFMLICAITSTRCLGGGDFQISTFYTYGWTKIFKDPSAWLAYYPDSGQYAEDNEVRLQSAGIGLSQTWSESVVIRTTIGRQIGENVLRQYNDYNKGMDYDESDKDYRAWIEAIYYF